MHRLQIRKSPDASDGLVDFTGFLSLSANFGNKTDQAFADRDLDANGRVDFTYFLILADRFGG